MKSPLLLLSVSALMIASVGARADDFAKKHPRRAQVLKRDHRLKNRVEKAEQNGKITQGQAQKLEKEDNAIHQQERADAAVNGGHITRAEQHDLNREENGVKLQLKHDEKQDARSPSSTAGALYQ